MKQGFGLACALQYVYATCDVLGIFNGEIIWVTHSYLAIGTLLPFPRFTAITVVYGDCIIWAIHENSLGWVCQYYYSFFICFCCDNKRIFLCLLCCIVMRSPHYQSCVILCLNTHSSNSKLRVVHVIYLSDMVHSNSLRYYKAC